MSLKSIIQLVIVLLIITILGSVYFKYFANFNELTLEEKIEEKEEEKTEEKAEEKLEEKLEEKAEEKLEEKAEEKIEEKDEEEVVENENEKTKKPEIKNVVKDVEYLTTDKNGNKYKILATSGRTNAKDKNILDLDNVRGIITSNNRSTVYIVSDYAEYNSSNLNSTFYQNVVINYEDKEITCEIFEVDMQTNIAIAYNNVVVTDPQSIMKAGKIILDIETKVININPENKKNKVKIEIN